MDYIRFKDYKTIEFISEQNTIKGIKIDNNVIDYIENQLQVGTLANQQSVKIGIEYRYDSSNNRYKIERCIDCKDTHTEVEITLDDIENYVSEDFFLNLHHLNYELSMLVILNPEFSCFYSVNFVGSALVESVRTHLRNILKFFDKSGYFDEATCWDYIDYLKYLCNIQNAHGKPNGNYAQLNLPCDISQDSDKIQPKLKLLEVKLNLATEHLSYIRSEINKEIREPAANDISYALKFICEKMDSFYKFLNEKKDLLIKQDWINQEFSKLSKRATNLPTSVDDLVKSLQQTISFCKTG